VGLVYGRVRTLCSLLEEALLPMAAATGDESFREAIEAAGTLYPRLTRFVQGTTGTALVDVAAIQKLWVDNRLNPPFSAAQLRNSLLGLGMPAGNPPPSSPAPRLEQVLTGLIFVRNLTSHRYPILLSGTRVEWFETWGGHLPAVNRAILWAALTLWGLMRHFLKQGNEGVQSA
jgi:hypothetical protein